LTTKLNSVTEDQSRKDATAFVDAAIAEGRAGLKPVRDEYIALHMRDAGQAKKLIEAMPKLSGSLVEGDPPAADANALTAEDRRVMALFGISEEDYRAQQAALGMKKEAL
ncbi:MAG: phage protease, partial [Pseudomonadota bacterium]|nr:phage protease [Pseudomonadota bacterium]